MALADQVIGQDGKNHSERGCQDGEGDPPARLSHLSRRGRDGAMPDQREYDLRGHATHEQESDPGTEGGFVEQADYSK